jgi:hypothetical protein
MRPIRTILATTLVVPFAAFVVPGSALADDDEIEPPKTSPASAKPDATYGRIAGDIGLVLGAGATFGPRSPRLSADLRFRYLETAGLFFTYEDGSLVSSSGTSAEPLRVLALGFEIRPLFMARWLTGHELGAARADLMIDSLALELGGFLAQPEGGTLGDQPGLQAGLGLEIPVFPRASGPWIGLHGGVRWSEAVLGGAAITGPDDRALFGTITIEWHQLVGAHVVDLRDTAPR